MSAARGDAQRPVPWTFPLAFLGAHFAFIPLLVLLLPRRVEAIAGTGAPLVLSWLLLAGALAASAGNIVAGSWSDRWLRRYGSRRGLIALGLAALVASFALLASSHTVIGAALSLILFQLALNLAFAPLSALLADYVPDGAKGAVAGLMGAALPLSFAGTAIIAWLFPTDTAGGFIANALLVALCIAPLLVGWGFGPLIAPSLRPAEETLAQVPAPNGDLSRAWLARFLVQLGASFVLGFLFVLLSQRVQDGSGWAGPRSANDAMMYLSLGATCLGALGAVAGGRLSDGARSRRRPQAIAAALLALGILGLGSGLSWPFFFLSYGLFQLALCSFLAINMAVVAQLVGESGRRGALLGVVNLANTVPAVLAPALVVASLDSWLLRGRLELFFLAAAAAAAFAILPVLGIRRAA